MQIKIKESIKNYNSLSVMNESYFIQRTDWRYILLPVWFMTYKYKGKVYEFAMNGQTGKFVGDLPIDKAKKKKNA